MRTFLALLLLIVCTSKVSGQFDFKLQKIDIDTVVEINGEPINNYFTKTFRYPPTAIENKIIGTYIGRIRIDSAGNLLLVSTVNSLGNFIDSEFESTIKSTWKKQNIKVKNLSDTIDIIIPIKYMLSNTLDIKPLEFFVNTEQAPENICNEIVIVGCTFTKTPSNNGNKELINFSNVSIADDMDLINNANENFKIGKYKKCIKYLNELIRRNPYNADIVFMRAKAYLAISDQDKACVDYNYLKSFLKSPKYKGLTECQ